MSRTPHIKKYNKAILKGEIKFNQRYKRKQFSEEKRTAVFERDNYICQNPKCGKNLIWFPRKRRVDHKIPLSKGGSNSMNNLQLLCDDCDKNKKNRLIPKLANEYVKARLSYLESKNKKIKKWK